MSHSTRLAVCAALAVFVSIIVWFAAPADAQVVLFRVNAGGGTVTSTDSGPDWAEDSGGSPSTYVNTGNTFSTGNAIDLTDPSVPAGTPEAIFQSERWDDSPAPEMEWDFPVTPGTYEVKLYFSEIWSGGQGVGIRIFDVQIEGNLVLDNYDVFADVGGYKGVVKTFLVSSDSNLDIDFFHDTQNPMIKAIEIISSDADGYLTADPASINFGLVEVGLSSAPQTITLSNLGDPGESTITLTNITVNGDFTHDLTLQSIAADASINFDAQFAPLTDGVQVGSIVIEHDGTNSPTTITLQGDAYIPGSTISFGKSVLSGASSNNPTSLQFGPDNRLYVANQNGLIKVYTIERTAPGVYDVIATETISLIQQIPNHNDDGVLNTGVNTRQCTGLLVVGTASNPVLYVSSSDPRIGAGGSGTDLNLDTNSGIVSRLTWNGSSWDKLDIVRGLPRSEENHSVNGMQLDAVTNTLYLIVGGHTNMGAPSNNFALTPEYALAAALLSIDLDAIGETTYDLPTLDDEDRAGPVDANDPFGGNDGKNQAMLVPGGPVQIHSPGWRNAYDILLTADGRMYTVDNGPNSGWGDIPISCSNQVNEPGSTYGDNLHYISGPGYYGGHPNPTRADMSNTFNATNPQSPVSVNNPTECTYLQPGVADGALHVFSSSTNGLCEYTASNFGGAMQGDLLTASFNNTIYRIELNAAGDDADDVTSLFSSVGATPLDVIAQGDTDIFNGTIWVCNYSSNDITVYEPTGGFVCTAAYDALLDEDSDGYNNADELDNGTNPCSAADIPADWDGDFISNLNDPDDDNDTLPDTSDPFAIDANNGSTTLLPVELSWNNDDPDPGQILNLGFTGLMTNLVDDYEALYDGTNMTPGGAAGVVSVDLVPDGDAFESLNDQQYGFQIGFKILPGNGNVTLHTRILAPFAGLTPTDINSMGMFFGNGDQDNYCKLVVHANGGAGGVVFAKEEAGVYTEAAPEGLLSPLVDWVELWLEVDPVSATVQPSYQMSFSGTPGLRTNIGVPVAFPASWLSGSTEPAGGIISTSRGAGDPFPSTWDFFEIIPDAVPATSAEAFVAITQGGGINASTFGNGSFIVTNNSTNGEKITRVRFDLSTAAMPDMVYDPDGIAGDLTAKCFTANSGTGTVGLVNSGDPCADPFLVPHDDGYDVIELTFTDFDPGETFTFSVDVDPTTIRGTGAPGPNESGSVSGLELSGSTVEVEFDVGGTLYAYPFRQPGSSGGAEGYAGASVPEKPGLNVIGIGTSPITVATAPWVARVTGPAGADVRLVVIEAGLYLAGLPGGGFDIDPYEANSAIGVTEIAGVIGGSGYVDIPIVLTASDPDAGYNYVMAALDDGAGTTGPTSDAVLLYYDPSVTGIPTVPRAYALAQNAPNPFNPTTDIRFALEKPGHTTLRIYDVAGRLVRTLVDRPLTASVHTLTWDARDRSGAPVASGVYFYRLTSGEFTETKRMVLLK